MKDLRKNQEALLSGDNISVKRIWGRWNSFIIILALIATLILKPVLIANLIGNWITSFFGTLSQSIKIEGVTSFNFILIVTVLAFVGYFVNKWIRSRSTETLSKTKSMTN
jgi:uncharacterized membrane protein